MTGSKLQMKKGQILVEALVSITIVTIGLLGIFSLLSQSLASNRLITDEYIATNLAAEGIELIKNLIDQNILEGKSWNGGGCLKEGSHELDYNDGLDTTSCLFNNQFLRFDLASGIYSYDLGTPTNFKRRVEISSTDLNKEIQVNSVVTWIGRGGKELEVNLEDRFFKWQ